ncbi:tetraacyldisaccharide 4'-kinase [Andreprevotia chitinilytica]|uniref:tetraacyldisaccharide 4'-kinase n=1 Tax=Andreprevotia chitinilytica TaxID=396808 RepID=UPI00055838E3|nr:tetraacyldisaccharide 4'-kinase [Andreprevotia chitinilytica]
MSRIEQSWYAPSSALTLLLTPLAWLFGWLAALRRLLFRYGISRTETLPVPVIVIGNLTAGGTGKTPLTAWIAQALAQHDWRPGIVSRGYGGQAGTPIPVHPDGDPAITGDEPLLLARTAGVPVFICRDRAAAGHALLAAHPDVNVILCDDGLQHYRLGREIELCVVDGARGFGNCKLLPAGPLREPVSRLQSVNAVIVNGTGDLPDHPAVFRMALAPSRFYRLGAPEQTRNAADFANAPLSAVCGIGNPQRFFNTLSELGLTFAAHPFPDHHAFSATDLPAGTLLVTEKDAVKLAALPDLAAADARIWVLPVTATLQPDLAAWLVEKLKNGCKIA